MPNTYTDAHGNMIKDSPADFKREKMRDNKLTLVEWIQALMTSSIPRYSNDPVLSFVLLNLKNRETSMSSTAFGVSNMPNEEALNVGQVKELMKENPGRDIQLGKQISALTSTITGSKQYWGERRKDCAALVRHNYNHYDRLPIVFTTGSMAEYHWQELFLVLRKIFVLRSDLGKVAIVDALSRGEACPAEYSAGIYKILQEEVRVVNELFDVKTKAWFKLVLQDGLDIDEFLRRYEFATHRMQIHFHAICWSYRGSEIHKLFNICMDFYTCKSKEECLEFLEESEKEIAKSIQTVIADNLIFLHAEHPAGRFRSNPQVPCTTVWYKNRVDIANKTFNPNIAKLIVQGEEDVSADMVGNVDQWPGHEGLSQNNSDSSSLRLKLFQVSPANLQQDLNNHANRVCLHCCSAYCLSDDQCRMHFGKRNKNVKAQTDGKPCRKDTAIVARNGVAYAELPRDHPRYLQGSLLLSRAWSANYDFQVIFTPEKDIGSIHLGESDIDRNNESVLEWINQVKNRVDDNLSCDYEAFKNNLQMVFANRNYLNKEENVDKIIDYVVAYVFKNEHSPAGMAQAFKNLLHAAPLDMEFGTFAQKANMALLKNRSISRGESLLLTQGLDSFNSTKTFRRISLNSTFRVLSGGGSDPTGRVHVDDDAPAVSTNQWDKFLLFKKLPNCSNPLLSFDKYNRPKENLIPVYSNDYSRATYPFTEDFARSVLTLHKPNIKSVKDIKGEHGTYVASLEKFLDEDRDHVPEYIKKSIKRAYLQFLSRSTAAKEKDASRRGVCGAAAAAGGDGGGGGGGGAYMGGGGGADAAFTNGIERRRFFGGDNDSDDELYNQGAAADNNLDDFLDYNGDSAVGAGENDFGDDLDASRFNIARKGYIPSETKLIREMYGTISELTDFLSNMSTSFYDSLLSSKSFELIKNKNSNTTYLDPLLALHNGGQRIFLCSYLRFLKNYCTWNDSKSTEKMPTFRPVVTGVAGTGKSFIMGLVKNFTNLCMGTYSASECLGPTGGSAGNCYGIVVDRARSIKRSSSTYSSLSENLNVCSSLQSKYKDLVVQLQDEWFMWGLKLIGHHALRCGEVLNNGECQEDIAGNVPASIVLGDPKQLSPVLDSVAYLNYQKLSELKLAGKQFYDIHNEYYVLDTPVRQDSQTPFMGMLTRLRDGTVKDALHFDRDLTAWNERRLDSISFDSNEKESFLEANPRCLNITCFNRERDDINSRYISNFSNVCIVRSILEGKHSSAKKDPSVGASKSIPIVQYYQIGIFIHIYLVFIIYNSIFIFILHLFCL